MEDNKTVNARKKPTYEELEAAMYNLTEKLNKAYKDNQYLVNQLNGINNTFTRLNYLFIYILQDMNVHTYFYIFPPILQQNIVLYLQSHIHHNNLNPIYFV